MFLSPIRILSSNCDYRIYGLRQASSDTRISFWWFDYIFSLKPKACHTLH